MKDFIRNMDKVGRLVVPIELCRAHGIEKSQPVAFVNTPDGILIRSATACCVACGCSDGLIKVENFSLCQNCAQAVEVALKVLKGKAAL